MNAFAYLNIDLRILTGPMSWIIDFTFIGWKAFDSSRAEHRTFSQRAYGDRRLQAYLTYIYSHMSCFTSEVLKHYAMMADWDVVIFRGIAPLSSSLLTASISLCFPRCRFLCRRHSCLVLPWPCGSGERSSLVRPHDYDYRQREEWVGVEIWQWNPVRIV